MAARLTIVNPIAIPEGDTPTAVAFAPAPRPQSLDGLRIGLFWNGKNQGDVALDRTRHALATLYEGATFTTYLGDKGGLTRYASEPLKQQILAECDVLVGTTADCGSCTSWLIREMAAFEERGLPTVGWVAVGFEEDARFSAEVFGCPDLPFAVVPLPFTNGDPVRIAQMVDDAIPQVIEGLTTAPTAERVRPAFEHLTLCADETITYDGDDLLACFDAMNAHFVANGWSDGMPLVPPTRAKVDAMVAASGRAADEVIGVFAPGMGIGTVEKIAANAVMAGAAPSAMPVILAMAECVLADEIGLRTFAMSTGPQAPIVMVSGPIADAIGMNHGVCALGPGSVSQVNVAIGRTLRLIMMNVGHSYPGVSDMDTIGSSMKFSACVAENEARNPWAPFRVLEGFGTDESTVTVNVPYGVCELFDFQNHDPDLLIEGFATVTRNVAGSPSPGVWLVKEPADPSAGYPFNGVYHNVVMMCPEHADVFAHAGWTIDDIKTALYERSVLPFRTAMVNKPMPLFAASHPELAHLLDAPDTDVHLYPSSECFQVFVVGAVAGRSLYFHGGTVSVTRPVLGRAG
ncbi:MAG: hypothetical protein FJW95_15470 [Actinobacteria bacterium]|nr:hypothetical protein [Actinomycetota bacterium]